MKISLSSLFTGLCKRIAASLRKCAGAVVYLKTWALQDIWDIELMTLPRARRALYAVSRVIGSTIRGFLRDHCTLHSARLTFVTLLSFIPVLALALSLAKVVVDENDLRTSAKESIHEIVSANFGLDQLPKEWRLPFASGNETEKKAENEKPDILPGVAPGALKQQTEAALPEGALGSLPEGMVVLDETRLQSLIDKLFDLLNTLNFRALGGIGLLLLLWADISVLSCIEEAFNKVWDVVETRPLLRKFTDYLSVTILLPFLAAIATSVPLVSMLQQNAEKVGASWISNLIQSPFVKSVWVLFLLTCAFAFLLRATPNTTVKVKPALIGGFAAALGAGIWLKICISLQIGVAKYSTLFGSFAIVPILLFWIYVSWQIILAGAEISYAVQHISAGKTPKSNRPASVHSRLLLAAELLHEISRRLADGAPPLSLSGYAAAHQVPARFLHQVSSQLCRAGILVSVTGNPDCVTAAVDLHNYTIGKLLRDLLEDGADPQTLGIQSLPSSVQLSSRLNALLLPENGTPSGNASFLTRPLCENARK